MRARAAYPRSRAIGSREGAQRGLAVIVAGARLALVDDRREGSSRPGEPGDQQRVEFLGLRRPDVRVVGETPFRVERRGARDERAFQRIVVAALADLGKGAVLWNERPRLALAPGGGVAIGTPSAPCSMKGSTNTIVCGARRAIASPARA